MRARERNRSVALGSATAAIVAVAVAGVVAVSGRDVPRRDDSDRAGYVPTVAAPATTLTRSTATTSPPPPTAPADESRWRPIAPHPDGIGWDVAATWMGNEAFVLGSRAYSFDPMSDAWRALAPFPEEWTHLESCEPGTAPCFGQGIGETPSGYGLVDPIMVWTGEKVLVMGGDQPVPEGSEQAAGCESFEARLKCYPNLVLSASFGYVPATDGWQLLAATPWFVNERSPHVWTGSELFVWPWDLDDNPDPPYAYDPATNIWRELPEAPISPRQNAASVWTGSEWLVWGGGDGSGEFADGAAYDPASGVWRVLPEAPVAARKVRGVWTGSEMLVMAGSRGGGPGVCCGNFALTDGAAYNPTTDTWRPLAGTVGHPGFAPLWTGDVLLMFAKGGVIVYDPATEKHVDVCCDGMAGSAHVWTGREAISFGSYTAERGGGIFTPP